MLLKNKSPQYDLKSDTNNMLFAIKRGKFIQIFFATFAGLPSIFTGLYVGWTSPMTMHFSSNNTKLQSGPMTTEEISLMSSLFYIGAILGAILSGWLVNVIGRKWSLLIWTLPLTIANVLIILAEYPLLLLISRILCGTIAGVSIVVPSIFVAEIVEDNLKATMGVVSGVVYNIGVFISKFITKLYGIYAVPIASFPLIFIFIGTLLICPDTPEYLLFRKRINQAEKSLRFYRGLPPDQPLPEPNALEFEEMKKQVSLRSETTSITLKDFSDGTTILAIIIVFILMNSIHLCGARILTSFTEEFINDSRIQMDLSLVDTCISSLQVIGCLASIYIVRRMGIRRSLIIYFSLSFIGLFGTAVHYFLHNFGYDLRPLYWSFLIFLTIAIVIPSSGINSLCLGVPPLILPLKIRGSVLGTTNVIQQLIASFMVHFYLYLMKEIGNSMILTGFSIWCLFGAIFTYFVIPEVNNLTFRQIVSSLNAKIPQRFRCSS